MNEKSKARKTELRWQQATRDDHAILNTSQCPNYYNYTFKINLSEVVEDRFFLRFEIFGLNRSVLSSKPTQKIISGNFKEPKQIIRENFRVLLHDIEQL